MIRESVRTRTPVAVDQMAEVLRRCDSVWLPTLAAAKPSSYRDLINLSYAVEQLRPGITHKPGEPELCVAIDNSQERRTCEEARTIAAGMDGASDPLDVSLLGVYPLERVFTSEATGTPDLYDHDPGHRFVERTGRQWGMTELLERAYPDLHPQGTPQEACDRRRDCSRSAFGQPAAAAPALSGRLGGG
jgi:hypothetical protein